MDGMHFEGANSVLDLNLRGVRTAPDNRGADRATDAPGGAWARNYAPEENTQKTPHTGRTNHETL